MCRLAAFPPGTKKDFAIWIMEEMVGCNTDGFGTAYLKGGSFVVDKTHKSFREALKNDKVKQFDHMPHGGWTIAHVRAKTHGQAEYRNTHPFIFNNYAFCHNGVFNDSDKIRKTIKYLGNNHKFQGETDSETVGYILDTVGLDKIDEVVSFGGVYLGLHKSGEIHVYKTTGDLEVCYMEQNNKGEIKEDGIVVLASEFPTKLKDQVKDSYSSGKMILTKEGKIAKISGISLSKKSYYDWKQGSLYHTSSDEGCESYLRGGNNDTNSSRIIVPGKPRGKPSGEDVVISVWNPECVVEDMLGDD